MSPRVCDDIVSHGAPAYAMIWYRMTLCYDMVWHYDIEGTLVQRTCIDVPLIPSFFGQHRSCIKGELFVHVVGVSSFFK